MGVDRRVTDEEAGEISQRTLGKMTLSELRQVEKDKRDEIVSRLKEIDGLSIRQIARITGFTVNIVAKA